MKKRIFAILICIVLIVSIIPLRAAFAVDPVSLTFSQLAGAAYAMGSSMGIQWGFTGSAVGAQDQMIGQLQNFAGTSSIDWWGAGEIKAIAGKLVIAQTAYEGVKGIYEHLYDFLADLIDNEKTPIISDGEFISGDPIPRSIDGSGAGFNWTYEGSYYKLYYYGIVIGSFSYGVSPTNPGFYSMINIGNKGSSSWEVYWLLGDKNNSSTHKYYVKLIDYAGSYIDYQNADKSLYPQALPLEAYWQGDWGEAPDTNLDQLIGSVFDDLADLGDIDVTGDIVEPAPVPTPVPTYPPATDVLGGINTEIEQGNDVLQGLNDIQDLMEGVNEGLNDIDLGIGQAAGNISDAVGEAAEGVGEAIGIQTGVISGAIDQAVSDVQTAIGEQTATLDESLSATAEGVETIAEAIEDEAINWQKFDLRGLFPFCIPFDIYNMLKALDASPTAPHVQLPFVIESIGFSYTIDLDFSAFDQVAAVMRQMELIVYGIALAWATSKVIKW